MITDHEVTEALDAVIAEVGEDYIYPDDTCRYVVRDDTTGAAAPSCIAARVLHRLGEPLSNLINHEGLSVDAVNTVEVQLSIDAQKALRQAQIIQDGEYADHDSRGTWGEGRQAYIDYLQNGVTVASRRYAKAL